MRFREWLHPHRQLLLALVAVAIVSAGALGWLGWLLITRDAALAQQQAADRLQQRAETAAAALRASLADLPRLAASTDASLSPSDGILRVDLTARGVLVRGDARVLWVPQGRGPDRRGAGR
jgi:Tfp pilus assembly protein PilN